METVCNTVATHTHIHTHTHQVLYHTLQTFAWKIDAKAAINAFCSLARLDTARLVQMAEPGQNSWEIDGNYSEGFFSSETPGPGVSPSDWAGAQVNMVSKIDI